MTIAIQAHRSRWPRQRALALSVIATLFLLVLHKPWALTTPQLWAEDGSIFLAEEQTLGAAALLRPYQGYLLLIPRLTALVWDSLIDVRWWPLAYNGTALCVYLVVLIRMASARFAVPNRIWLILSFGFVAQTGETLLNITNAQWVSAFLLIQQLLLEPAATRREIATDLVLVVLAGLTGPFAVALLPLFAWQAWRHRDRSRWLGFIAVALCAATQAWFLIRSPGGPPTPRPESFSLLNYLAVIGGRVVVWPLFGRHAATTLSPLAMALVGAVLGSFVAGRVLLSEQRRGPALIVLLSGICLLAAISYRARPDGWPAHDIDNGDRYYFMPRILFVWLLILQFSARQRWIAVTARIVCVVGAVLELPDHVIPAPPDYHWSAQVEPIRRGVPADIRTLPRDWIFHYPGRPSRR